jgi:NAD(P)-dependent dehydrogenase (short-subunit alcohol dehydrogenase family)
MAGKLAGKAALITGAGSRQGAAMTTLFIQEGAKVVLADINEPGMREVTADLDAESYRILFCDVAKGEDVQEAVATAIREFGGIDILCNVAGIGGDPYTLVDVPDDRVVRQFDVHFFGPLRFMKHSIPSMIERGGGSIINIGSVFGLFGNKGSNGTYGAMKAALMHLNQTVAANYGAQKIKGELHRPGNHRHADRPRPDGLRTRRPRAVGRRPGNTRRRARSDREGQRDCRDRPVPRL